MKMERVEPQHTFFSEYEGRSRIVISEENFINIMKTCLYNVDPLNPTYIVKLGFTGVYISFLISAQKHGLWVLVRTAFWW